MEREALLVDLYELTMAAAYVGEGMADAPATFSLFVRDIPDDRGYLIAAGLDDALSWLERLRFGADERDALAGLDLFDDAFLDWLGEVRFTGRVRAVAEGTPVFAEEPILEVDAPLGVAQLAETYLLNQVTFQTLIITKCARTVAAAGEASVVDFALRRTHGIDAGMKLVRCGRIAGVAGTSNVAGAVRYNASATGTMAHAFVQAYPDETDAFRAFARRYRERTVLLVDTYDTLRGVERAITVAREMRHEGVEIRGIRLDSGDLGELSRRARTMLDDAGFPEIRIIASGGLDEFAIGRLRDEGAPIDGFGVGTQMGVSADQPALDSVYKLVEVDGTPVHKTSEGKAIWPGPKQVWRRPDFGGDVLATADEPGPSDAEPLLATVMEGGERTVPEATALDAAAERCRTALAAMPDGVTRLRDPERYLVEVSAALRQLAADLADH